MSNLIYNPRNESVSSNMRTIARLLKEKNVVLCTSSAEIQKLKELLEPTLISLADIIVKANLGMVFIYDPVAQTKESGLREIDGRCYAHIDTVLRTNICAIGLSTLAMYKDDSREYLPFLFLHELAHRFTGMEHTTKFENYLTYILSIYKHRTGVTLHNDYSGYNLERPTVVTD